MPLFLIVSFSDIWDQYLEFESQVGDLTSVLKVDSRRREVMKEQFEDKQAILLVDRYRFLNLAPCTAEQLRFMGYAVSWRPRGGNRTLAAEELATLGGGAVGA